MSPPTQGFRYHIALGAADSTGDLAMVAPCGASRGGGIQLSGTFVGTVQFEQSQDNGATWIAKPVYPAAGGAGVTSATAAGNWKFTCGGETQVRARCSAYTSGSIVVDATFTAGSDSASTPGSSGTNPLPTGRQSVIVSAASITANTAASAYTAGNVVGGLLHFAGCVRVAQPTGVLQGVGFVCKSTQTTSFSIALFSANPSVSTFTDKSAPSLAAADMPKYIGSVTISNNAFGTPTLYSVNTTFIVVQSAGTDLYGVLTCVSTPTFGSTSDIVNVYLSIQQD